MFPAVKIFFTSTGFYCKVYKSFELYLLAHELTLLVSTAFVTKNVIM